MNTEVSYLYRDPGGVVLRRRVIFTGSTTSEHSRRLRRALHEGLCFIPSQVGLPPCSMVAAGCMPSPCDEKWHELPPPWPLSAIGCASVDDRSVEAFVLEVEQASRVGWKPSLTVAPADTSGMLMLDDLAALRGSGASLPVLSHWAVARWRTPGRVQRILAPSEEATRRALRRHPQWWGEAYTDRGWRIAVETWTAVDAPLSARPRARASEVTLVD